MRNTLRPTCVPVSAGTRFAGETFFFVRDGRRACGVLTPEKLLERHSSFPRNKNIAEVFYRAEIAKQCGVSTKTVGRHLAGMKQVVRFVGSGYSGHWEIATPPEQTGGRKKTKRRPPRR